MESEIILPHTTNTNELPWNRWKWMKQLDTAAVDMIQVQAEIGQ
jgi:hypothetical protein